MIQRRGTALVVTMVALAVLLLLVAGAITFTGQNREAAAAKLGGDEMSACATAGRQYLLSRLQLFGIPVTEITVDSLLPDDPDPARQTRVMNAHYGDAVASTTIVSVQGAAFSAAGSGVREAANTISRSGTFGQYYKVVVKCQDAAGRETETEFLFRYGL